MKTEREYPEKMKFICDGMIDDRMVVDFLFLVFQLLGMEDVGIDSVSGCVCVCGCEFYLSTNRLENMTGLYAQTGFYVIFW